MPRLVADLAIAHGDARYARLLRSPWPTLWPARRVARGTFGHLLRMPPKSFRAMSTVGSSGSNGALRADLFRSRRLVTWADHVSFEAGTVFGGGPAPGSLAASVERRSLDASPRASQFNLASADVKASSNSGESGVRPQRLSPYSVTASECRNGTRPFLPHPLGQCEIGSIELTCFGGKKANARRPRLAAARGGPGDLGRLVPSGGPPSGESHDTAQQANDKPTSRLSEPSIRQTCRVHRGVCHAPDQQKAENGRLAQRSACFVAKCPPPSSRRMAVHAARRLRASGRRPPPITAAADIHEGPGGKGVPRGTAHG